MLKTDARGASQHLGLHRPKMEKIVRSDADIKRDVEDELRWSPEIDATDVAVTVKNGAVELAGFVPRYSDKFEAEVAAKRVAGVAGLANDIEVRLAHINQRPDPDIARDAVSAIGIWVPAAATSITPIVQDGWITLEGTAEWYYQKEAAETAVRRLLGVKGVSNLIQIKPQAAPSEVKRKIEEALIRNASIDASRITVHAIGGEVTLKGSVRSWAERQEAEDVAWAAPGVTLVDDQLAVRW